MAEKKKHPDARIDIQICWMGQDPVFLVTGGVAHLGASAVAYGDGNGDWRSEVMTLPGHRETELAEQLARMAASKLGRPAAVLVGIHLHQPTRQEIEEIVAEAVRTMEDVLEDVQPGS